MTIPLFAPVRENLLQLPPVFRIGKDGPPGKNYVEA
jgi:hypothetical protein